MNMNQKSQLSLPQILTEFFSLICFALLVFFFFVLSLIYKISISCPARNMADEIELRGRIGWTCRMKARVRKGGGGGW